MNAASMSLYKLEISQDEKKSQLNNRKQNCSTKAFEVFKSKIKKSKRMFHFFSSEEPETKSFVSLQAKKSSKTGH